MDQTTLFIAAVVLTVAASACVINYLNPHLRPLLVELCGTEGRADFWITFSHIILVLVPLAISLLYQPKASGLELVFQVSNHVAVSLLGLAATVLGMGGVVGMFIPKTAGKA